MEASSPSLDRSNCGNILSNQSSSSSSSSSVYSAQEYTIDCDTITYGKNGFLELRL